MADWIQRLKDNNNLQAMITLHTFGQLWLVPYGYTSPPVYPPDYDELVSIHCILLRISKEINFQLEKVKSKQKERKNSEDHQEIIKKKDISAKKCTE